MREILSRPHLNPDRAEIFVAERTLRTWLAKYNLYGFDGLKNLGRCDKGHSHAIPVEILDKAENCGVRFLSAA